MSGNNKLYGCLFLLVIGVSIVAGFMVASSLPSVSVANPLARLQGATSTPAHVEVRLITPSPGQAEAGSAATEAVPEGTGDAPAATQQPAQTVAAPTLDYGRPTATEGPAAGSTPTRTPTASRTATPTRTPSPTRSAFAYVAVGTPAARPEKACYVGAVFGYVYDDEGRAVEGVHVRVSDPWGNVFTAVTKPAPDAGYYDVIQGSGAATWYVVVVDSSGTPLSAVVTVEHPEGDTACWYQVDFRGAATR